MISSDALPQSSRLLSHQGAAERAYADNSNRKHQNAFVTVRVHHGDAALEQLYIDNKPLVDYLRAEKRHK